MSEYIELKLDELLDFIKSVGMAAIVHRSLEGDSAICIEVSGYKNTGDVFYLDGDVTHP